MRITGADQQTLEARAYAVARAFKPLLVNSVVGFIGPEYLFDGKEIMRAGLEDHFCAKLMGVPMGVDVCYTNHAEADQDDMDALLALLVAAGVNFVMGVPGADDIMLGYQSTSFHDALAMRDLFGRRPAPEFEAWLSRQGLLDGAERIRPRALPGKFRRAVAMMGEDEIWQRAAPADGGAHRAQALGRGACDRRRFSTSGWRMPAPAMPCMSRSMPRAWRGNWRTSASLLLRSQALRQIGRLI